MELREELLSYVTVELLDNEVDVGPDDSLLQDGLVDSLGLMRLVGHIEATLECTVPLEDIVLENFRTVSAMLEYLGRAGHIAPAA